MKKKIEFLSNQIINHLSSRLTDFSTIYFHVDRLENYSNIDGDSIFSFPECKGEADAKH